MKRTYTRTMMHENLEAAKVTIVMFDGCKYTEQELGKARRVTYTGLTSWDIISGGEEATEFESHIDSESVDEFHEYLVLHFNDGTESSFRNSHCDMFIE